MDDDNLPALMLHALQGLTQAGQARRLRCFSRLNDWRCAHLAFCGSVMLGLNTNFSDLLGFLVMFYVRVFDCYCWLCFPAKVVI